MKLALISLASLLTAMSCGGASKSDKGQEASPAPEVESGNQLSTAEESVVAQEFKSIPDAVIIRVPVNADGTEDSANASMRTYNGAPITSNESALNAYTSLAQDVGNTVENELDADSSTNSWQAYRPNPGRGYPQATQTQYYNNSQSTSLNVNYAGFGQRFSLEYQNTQSTTVYQSSTRGGGYGGGYGGCGNANGCGNGNYYSNYRPFYYSGIGRSYGWHYNQARRWVSGGCNYYVYPRY
jgi:hypothetical protein